MLRFAMSLPIRLSARSLSKSAVAHMNDLKPSSKEFEKDTVDSVNRVELIGGVSEVPSKKVAKNGTEYVIFNVITNSTFRYGSGSRTEQSERHTVTAFGRTAEIAYNNVTKGTRVLVHGRLHYSGNQLKEDGTRSPKQTHIHAETIQPIAKRSMDQNDD